MNILQRLLTRIRAATLRDPPEWLREAFGVYASDSGENVSEATTLSLSAYYCGMRMISETVGSLPLRVYRRTADGRDIARDHVVDPLLHTEPNPEMTAMGLRQTMVAHCIGWGNAFAEIVRRGDGMPSQLWLLLPNRTRPRRADDGSLFYEVRLDDGSFRYIPARDVLHVPGLGFDGLRGYSILQVARNSIGYDLAQHKYGSKFFANGGHVSMAAETDNVLGDDAFKRLKSELVSKIGGLNNAHRIALLEAGVKLKPLNITNEDAQFIENKRFSVEEWARWLNMPPHKLKEMTHATFSNIEHQNIEWVVDSLRPWMVRFEQEYNRKLFRQKNVFYAEHNVEGLLRGDTPSRYAAYHIARMDGWLNANEIREKENLNKLSKDIGDTYLVPRNMIRADLIEKEMEQAAQQQQPQLPPPESEPEEDDDREQNILRATASRLVKYEMSEQRNGRNPYGNDLRHKVKNWLFVNDWAADHYCHTSKLLDFWAVEKRVPVEQVASAKIELLVDLARNGG